MQAQIIASNDDVIGAAWYVRALCARCHSHFSCKNVHFGEGFCISNQLEWRNA